jgi:pimeloyl-ACP methyl ester carboxylesterase
MDPWKRAALDEVELEYQLRGAGDPIVFIHNGAGADWFTPFLDVPSLTSRFRLLTYHRAGYAGSSPLPGPLTFAQEAARCQQLMHHLGIERAHVVGHSSSGNMALQLALDAPDVVGSLVLMEPALISATPSSPQVLQAIELYRAGDKAGAVDTFLRATCDPDYRSALETALPSAVDQALADADTFFSQELPALRQRTFGPDDARRVTQPVLAVAGERTDPIHRQRWELLIEWLPNVEPFVLPGASHLLHLQNLEGMAEGLSDFYARHALRASI